MKNYYALQSDRGTDYVSFDHDTGTIKIKQAKGLYSDYQDAIEILPTLDDTDWDIIEEDLDELLTADYYVRLAEYCREDRYLGEFRWYALTSEYNNDWGTGTFDPIKADIMLYDALQEEDIDNPEIVVIADGDDPVAIGSYSRVNLEDFTPEQLGFFIRSCSSWTDPDTEDAVKLLCKKANLDFEAYDNYETLADDIEKALGIKIG